MTASHRHTHTRSPEEPQRDKEYKYGSVLIVPPPLSTEYVLLIGRVALQHHGASICCHGSGGLHLTVTWVSVPAAPRRG